MPHISIATIDNPEFINLQPLDINPLMSKCEIKVLYVGQNRNRTYITEEVATEMAKTLRGAPIVGYYNEQKEDFTDHGDRITIDSDGIKFEKMTRPYGFVSPDAEVWFQNFEDTDDFGNKIVHKYLMTTGYLWTGQYEEAKIPLQGSGSPHSMELDEDTMEGHWSEDINSGIEFFIINDAIFSKLCILGQDTEPCFEGSSVTAPQISSSFTLDDGFKRTLFNMMQQLQFALEGGQQMGDNKETAVVEEVQEQPTENFSENQGNVDETIINENQETTEEQETQETSYAENKEDKAPETENSCGNDDDDDKKKYSLLQEEYSALESKFNELQSNYQALVSFKDQVENEKKDALINSFYMLSDEDKKDVIEHKSEYSLDDIEAKLSVICVRKKVNFNLDEEQDTSTEKKAPTVEYNLNENAEGSVPAWISALRNTKNSRNN